MYFDWNLTIEELQIYRELGYLLFLKMFVKKSCEAHSLSAIFQKALRFEIFSVRLIDLLGHRIQQVTCFGEAIGSCLYPSAELALQ